VNNTVEAVGFDFIRTPELKYTCSVEKPKGQLFPYGVIQITRFRSESLLRDLPPKDGRETLSMVLVDYKYDGDVFNFSDVYYADAIEVDWKIRFPLERLGEQAMLIFVDKYGNEAREVVSASNFGISKKANKISSARHNRGK
jgi:hypothetical protein